MKKLLQRILGYLITVDDVKIVEKIVRNMFILTLNRFEHTDVVVEAKLSLKRISEDHSIDSTMENEGINEIDEYDTIICTDDASKFKNWIKNIIQDVRIRHVDELLNNSITADIEDEFTENLYYVSDKKQRVFTLFSRFSVYCSLVE